MLRKIFLFVFICLITLDLYATENIDGILKDIENKSDLSVETKLQNSGISTIYTRKDLERMQVKVLRDIFKSYAFFGYAENRFGIADPLTNGSRVPSMSSIIKIYIDNQEITSGIYGSGISILSDIGLDFVDHIEIYTQSTTYEHSIEPALMLIRLYTKSAKKDEGSKLLYSTDSYASSHIDFYNVSEVDREWSYLLYGAAEQSNNKHYEGLSKDSKNLQAFISLHKENQKIQLLATHKEQDAFIGLSSNAKPIDNTLDIDSLHIGYDGIIDDFSFLLSYELLQRKYDFLDNNFALENEIESHIVTTKLQYKKCFENHQLIIGVKERFKYYDTLVNIKDGEEIPSKLNKSQNIYALFFEEQYSPFENVILTAGVEFLKVININAKYNAEDAPFLYRFGLTYLYDNFVLKLIGSSTQAYLEPYMIDSDIIVEGEIDNFQSDVIFTELEYRLYNIKFDAVFGKVRAKNYLYSDPTKNGIIDQYNQIVRADFVTFDIDYTYAQFNKFSSLIQYTGLENMPIINKKKMVQIGFRNLHSYDKFDLYEELVYDYSTEDKVGSYDLSLGSIYKYNADLKFSIKGENLLNDSKLMKYPIQDVVDGQAQSSTLDIQTIDRRIIFTVEYTY